MCGICGQYNFKTQAPSSRETVLSMTRSIAHRGPDDEGFYFSGALGLGFRRLSIIDLAGGHQPMSDREKTVWVIFNGEIYNFPELKAELEGYGHVFQTRSDTETIVHGYKQWGVDVFQHLNGMFGVAIWDERAKRLVVARDAMGIKLVYYRLNEAGLTFGSEIRPLLASENGRPGVDPSALSLFLRYRYTPSPLTMYQGIRKLPAGCMLVCENGDAREVRWYRYKPQPFSPMPRDEEAKEELLAIYKRALKRHLLSDVPVGLLLSGGVDSGLLLALMNLYGDAWHTYTIGYGHNFAGDELHLAAETARIFGSKHVSIALTPESFKNALPKVVASVEEPIAASSIVPMYLVCERARQDVKVALIGQGPDELFGGYRRHLGLRYGGQWASLPSWIRQPLARAIEKLPRNETLKRGTYALHVKDKLQRYEKILSILPGSTVNAIFRDDVLPDDADTLFLQCAADLSELMSDTDELGGFQFLEVRSTLPDELLMYGDKLSMAHGLEGRVPFLDREIVEWVERLDARFKVRRFSRKWIHKQVCKTVLPRTIINRKKQGFGVNVVDDWFRDSAEAGMNELLLDPSSLMYEYLQPAPVAQLLKAHVSGHSNNHKLLFSLVVFEQWLRQQRSLAPARGLHHSLETAQVFGSPSTVQ
jgi:asparagine synthase (glutamine-hydrolysing)